MSAWLGAASPRMPADWPLPLITATRTSGPGPGVPGYSSRTVGRPRRGRQRSPAARRGYSHESRQTVAPAARPRPRTRSGRPAEVLGSDRVEELTELLYLVLLLVRYRDPGLLEDLVGREDRGTGAQRQGDRVRWPRADLLAVREDQIREERAVAQGSDVHRAQLHVECLEDVAHQVMGQRPHWHQALLRIGDRRRLHRADPNRQVPFPLRLFEQDDGLVRGHLDPDAYDLHLPHGGSVLTCA